jgi:plasmid replication initiation protein
MEKQVMKLSNARQINKSRELGVLLGSSLMQRRILYSCLAVMNPVVPHLQGMSNEEIWEWILDNGREALNLRTYHIDMHDFASVWGLKKSKSVGDQLNVAIGYDETTKLSSIMQLCFKYQAQDSKSVKYINVINSAKVEDGVLTVRFTDEILPFLVNLSSYTTIPLKATVGFSCNYSFAMLEYLLRRFTKGGEYPNQTINLDDLHQILGTSGVKSYKAWTNFKQRVLDAIEKDFSLIDGGGYDIHFEPVYAKAKGRGRRSIEAVEISFSNKGLKRFQSAVSARKAGWDHFQENIDDALLPADTAETVKKKRAQQNGKKPKEPELDSWEIF